MAAFGGIGFCCCGGNYQVVKFDEDLAQLWRYYNASYGRAEDIAVDSSGNSWACIGPSDGSAAGSHAGIGTTALVELSPSGSATNVITTYPAGKAGWNSGNPTYLAGPTSVAITPTDTVYSLHPVYRTSNNTVLGGCIVQWSGTTGTILKLFNFGTDNDYLSISGAKWLMAVGSGEVLAFIGGTQLFVWNSSGSTSSASVGSPPSRIRPSNGLIAVPFITGITHHGVQFRTTAAAIDHSLTVAASASASNGFGMGASDTTVAIDNAGALKTYDAATGTLQDSATSGFGIGSGERNCVFASDEGPTLHLVTQTATSGSTLTIRRFLPDLSGYTDGSWAGASFTNISLFRFHWRTISSTEYGWGCGWAKE